MENKIQRVKMGPPPPELPVAGKFPAKDISFIGRTNWVAALEEKKFIFGIKRSDRQRPLYVIGKGGVGKSKLLELLMRQDVAYGYGLCFIDSHGETIHAMLDFIPEERIEDVVVIDPADTAHPACFNPFVGIDPSFRNQVAQGFIEAMERQFGANWGPRLEHVLRFACLALLDYSKDNLSGLIEMLTSQAYRASVIPHIENELVRHFWQDEFTGWAEKYESEAIAPLVNKLSQFLSDPLLARIFTNPENKINFDDLVSRNKIVFVNLARERIGEDNASFLGSMFITKLKQAGMARTVPREAHEDFYVYIDEFQSLATKTFESILSESRKYGLNLTLTHQFAGQLPQRVHTSVLGTAGSIIIFRIGGEDASKLKPEMAPVFDAKDMINLGIGEFYIKMTIDGEAYDPFSAATLKVMTAPHPSNAERILAASRRAYSAEK